MAKAGHSIYCSYCGSCFFVCSSCYRGHKYCSSKCRSAGYEEKRRLAHHKYNSSLEAKLDHRDRQRIYRSNSQKSKILNQFVLDKTSNQSPNQLDEDIPSQEQYCLVCGCKVIWGDSI